MIGLKRFTVRLEAHDPLWQKLYEREAREIEKTCGGWYFDLQHVGSTSVPDLIAKPILDIAMLIADQAVLADLVGRLERPGYIDRGEEGFGGGYLMVKESRPSVRIVHLHIVDISNPEWGDYIAFRDVLRTDPKTRDQYASLKQQSAKTFSNDRGGYAESKGEFIRSVINKAREQRDG